MERLLNLPPKLTHVGASARPGGSPTVLIRFGLIKTNQWGSIRPHRFDSVWHTKTNQWGLIEGGEHGHHSIDDGGAGNREGQTDL